MPETRAEILQMAQRLPAAEQRLLINEIGAMLPQPPDGMTDEEFEAELDRRWEACESGRMTSAPWEEVMNRLEQKNRADG
jgi:putative addiction module component (TIGR02574 family)